MENVIMFYEIERFQEANERVNKLSESLIGRDIIVHKNLLGYFYEEGEMDELLCKVIGYDGLMFKVTHEDLTGKTEEVENYVTYEDLLKSDSEEVSES